MGYALFHHQPFKSVYLLYAALAACLRIPYWALVSLPRAWRPRKSWTWRRTMQVKLVRYLTSLANTVGPLAVTPNYLALVPGIGYHGVWVDPVPPDLIVGKLQMWASVAGVSPVKLPGYWIHKPGSTINLEAPIMPGEKIAYCLHGGAYSRLSAHPSDPTAGINRGLLEQVDSVHRTFTIEYRLSSTKPYPVANPFPAALVDALTGYNYLVTKLHIAPSDIIVEGDSAGGNLALALVRYLVEYPNTALPPPGALLLLSPWCDLGTSHSYPGSSYFTCRDSDYIAIPANGSHYSTIAFTGPLGLGATEVNPYISPASTHIPTISFAGFPPTFISAGGAEVLCDSIRTLHHKMAKDMGDTEVKYLETADCVHDFLVFDKGAHEPERGDTLKAIAEWVTSI
ncbi:Alpha/Beta hydrolase protein [Mycena rosella]|uniref:Alpha/Beta hydrolase protein n=1 Tax=Mycena rosella TaxID=1033263 RepID=A0AAD7GRD7_MYCRO|nr:Alpha/Beta hydrolase protein [Mycena rosella]